MDKIVNLAETARNIRTVIDNHRYDEKEFASKLALETLKLRRAVPVPRPAPGDEEPFFNPDANLTAIEDMAINVGDGMLGSLALLELEFGKYEKAVTVMIDGNAAKMEQARAVIRDLQISRPIEHRISDPVVRHAVWNLTDGHCAYCCGKLDCADSTDLLKFHVDHLVPKAAGGPDNLTNYVPSCHACNTSKTSNHVLHFIRTNISRLKTPVSNVVPFVEAAE